MEKKIKVSRKEIAPIIAVTYPEYRGRKCAIEFTDKVTFYDTNWSGGTRNKYIAIKSNGQIGSLPVRAPWVNPVEGMTVDLPVDTMVVEHSDFCGHDMGITIYMNPVNAPKWLNA